MSAVAKTLDALDPSNSSKGTMKIENTEKRDALIVQEKKYQKAWADEKLFEANAPSIEEFPLHSKSPADLHKQFPKFFGTMAYPYMNGTLHAGHSFTVSKIEFAAGVARMQGRRVLYPQGYHCTGMPIKACADKLVREIEMFGTKFERCPAEDVSGGAPTNGEVPAPTQEAATKEDVTKFSAKKSEAAAKTVAVKYQFQIMLSIGVPLDDIHRFADPQHWLQYFPPLCKRDLTNLGCRIDWRRQFVTTDANPYYDAFVRWQMNRLREMDKIKFGKRYTVYSPKDGQPCMDHDRSEGEGIAPQEYTAMKLKVKEWSEPAKKILDGKLPTDANVYFVPATLRPETMYGQTCCFVGPSLTYGIFKAGENTYYFISDRAARNMAYQSIFAKWGEFPKIAVLQGSDVVGTLVNAPLSVHKDGVRILPMETVKATKGTGVVTSVPSDSPDDYATVMDLAKKAEYYGIKKEWVDLEMPAIIETPSYGNNAAKFLVEQLKINSPKDTKQLAEAKDLAYKEGFYKGKMLIGDFKGQSVIEAKPRVKAALIESGDAFEYAEPDGFVLSRSGDECVAAHLDQWYMDYGKDADGNVREWLQQVLDHVNNGLNTFSTETKNAFEQTLGWLGQWACARSYGLGTKLPWDPQFLVESLSDSTIYMSYYTICHLLHKDIFGKEVGPAGVKPEQMTDEVWDFIFRRKEGVKTDIPKESLDRMQREFEYWYPLTVRVSGKDLIQNHLSFWLYVHIALFDKKFWPEGVRVNGHLLLNGKKMSKSSGNFLTLKEATDKFGADATRIALADAGDGMDDANFAEDVANSNILRLFELRKWCEEMVKDVHIVKSADEYAQAKQQEKYRNSDAVQRDGERNFWDKIFENELRLLGRETIANYNGTFYKSALRSGLYDLTSARDSYRASAQSAGVGMHHDLIKEYIRLQALMLTPLAPHWSEYIWREVLQEPKSIQLATFPELPEPDQARLAEREYVRTTTSGVTSAEGAQQKKLAKGKVAAFDPKKDKKIIIFVAKKYPSWQDRCIELVRQNFANMTVDVKEVSKKVEKSETKKAMPFIQGLKRRLESGESQEAVFERKLPFDEETVLKEMAPGLKATIPKCKIVEIVRVEEGKKDGVVVGGVSVKEGEVKGDLPPSAEGAIPGIPTTYFENI